MKYPVAARIAGAMILMCAAGASMAGGPDAAKLEKGKEVFLKRATPACAVCHTLQDAGAAGTIGPNLDELKPTYDQVKSMVIEGAGAMPAFGQMLDEASIDAVAAYVSHITGGGQ
ncbi:c-type cytochrome [Pusillimonas sp. TS35]|uniref:SorU family sulfite dehydrogenase c-type cytochrome subunit n=1 Tax=Paracandidimonas lactea TaxID=2895524 RepID=UPI00137110F0|nr:cytochrome c [Paracandidimonas lactea]MYN13177.1 c-type cytochrome [Pusillimonas sp. TS35]